MAEGPEEEFACVVKEPQQEEEIELKSQQRLLIVINHGLSFREAGQRVCMNAQHRLSEIYILIF